MSDTDSRVIDLLKLQVRDVPDFPTPGVVFKDITPLLLSPDIFQTLLDLLEARLRDHAIEGIAAIESRGFLFGAPIADRLGVPLVLVRKPGKLPWRTVGLDYALEYGKDRLEVHADAIQTGRRYAVVDDVLATGGTALTAAALVEQQGGVVACLAWVIELSFLHGLERFAGRAVERIMQF